MLSARLDSEKDSSAPQFFIAGHAFPAGIYIDVGRQREVQLDSDGLLPATCDGRVAVYLRRAPTWGDLQRIRKENR